MAHPTRFRTRSAPRDQDTRIRPGPHRFDPEVRRHALAFTLLVVAHPAPEDPAWEPAPRAKEYPWMSVSARKKLHAGHLGRTNKGGVNVALLGDSITQRRGAPVRKKRFEPLDAANYAIGGDTTREVLYRVHDSLFDGIKPRAVVLMIGTNNFGLPERRQFGDDACELGAALGRTVLAECEPLAPIGSGPSRWWSGVCKSGSGFWDEPSANAP